MTAYDAFISYSHSKDKALAAALQTAIQRMGKAWYQRRSLRVFRDDTSLSASPHLWPSIQAALDQSRYFILLASPEAAASPWVEKELQYWIASKSVDNILIGVTDGKLAWDPAGKDFVQRDVMPLPRILFGRFSSEPRWVDFTAFRSTVKPNDVKFIDHAADFAAAIHNTPKEDLFSQELRQQRRALAAALSAALTLFIAGVVASWQWYKASVERSRAEGVLAASTQNADSLLDNAVKLRNTVGVPVDLVRDILDQAERLQARLTQYSDSRTSPARAQAMVLREQSRNLLNIGNAPAALEAAQHSRNIVERLMSADGSDLELQDDLSRSFDAAGEALLRVGRSEEAIAAFQKALSIREKLTSVKRDNDHQRVLAIGYERVGDRLFDLGRRDEAKGSYRKSFMIRETLASANPENKEFQSDLAIGYDRLARLMDDRDPDTLIVYNKSLGIRETLVAANPRMLPWQRDLATTYDKIGDILLVRSRANEALASYRKSFAIREMLSSADPQNAQLQIILVVSLVKLADVDEDQIGRLKRARELVVKLSGEGKLGVGQSGWLREIERRLERLSN